MNPKPLLLLFGALVLIGAACGSSSSSSLSTADKRRVIRNMLDAQKDIRQALMKIRRQIQGDLNSTGHNGAAGDDSDDDDIDDQMGGDGFGDMSGEEEEEFFKEQQRKIREVREKLETDMKKMAASLIAINEFIEKIDKKVDEAIQSSKNKNYNFYFHGKAGNHQSGAERPEPTTTAAPLGASHLIVKPAGSFGYGGYSYGGSVKDMGSTTAAPKPAEEEPFLPVMSTGSGKKSKKPNRTYRTRKSLDGAIPTVDSEQISNADIPNIVGHEAPIQKAVEFQQNQHQVEK